MIGIGGAGGEGAGGRGVGGESGLGGNGAGGSGTGGNAAGGSGAGGNAAGGSGAGGHVVDAGMDVRDAPVDMGADIPVDRPVDAIIDVPADVLVCGTGTHRCGSSCVANSSTANCGPTACVPCPVPANASATCDGTSCGFSCNTGFTLVGGACVRTCDMNCAATAITVNPPGGRFTGTTSGTSANSGSCGGSNAPETVYQLTLTQTSDVFVTTHGSKLDTVIYMRRGCCGAEVACNDNADGRTTSVLSATSLTPGTYDIFVDGAGTTGGQYTVDIYTSAASTNPGEDCGRPMRIANLPISGATTCGYRDDYSAAASTCGKDDGGLDVVFYFVLDQTTTVTFDTCTGTCIDTELYIRDVCTSQALANEIACNDDACGGQPANPDSCLMTASQSRVSAQLGPGVHYVVLDTFVNPGVPTCGLISLAPSNVPP